MDANHFDRLAKVLSTARTRRAALRGAVGLVGGVVTARTTPLRARAAAPAPPIPPPSLDPWPACSETQSHYCVAAFSVDGVDQLTNDSDYFPVVVGTASQQGLAVADRLEWHIYPRAGELQSSDLNKAIVLRIRSGQLEPVMTVMRSTAVRMRTSGDASSGFEVEVRGRPAPVPSCNEGLCENQADMMFYWF